MPEENEHTTEKKPRKPRTASKYVIVQEQEVDRETVWKPMGYAKGPAQARKEAEKLRLPGKVLCLCLRWEKQGKTEEVYTLA